MSYRATPKLPQVFHLVHFVSPLKPTHGERYGIDQFYTSPNLRQSATTLIICPDEYLSFRCPAKVLGRGSTPEWLVTSLGKILQVLDPNLIDNLLAGDKRALARSITLIERSGPDARNLLQSISSHVGRSYTVGITGPPGAGKSTLVDRIASDLRNRSGWNGSSEAPKVGILAADPTSPFTGGAILADRVRMQRHYKDPGVYIRSMATRGSQGGLPRCTRDAVKLLDVYGTPM